MGMRPEIEFEHTGTGAAVEKEFTEAGEWEAEIEKGGEVELEQFWIQKSFAPQFNVRIGHLVVPVGGLNNAHEPLNFFTVYRPEGEFTILPSTWHDTGISLWCRTTPLWGRGLSKANTGAEDRLHDDRARNVIEAIMWHGYSKKSDAYAATEKFYYLSPADREAVVAFIDAI